MNDADDRLDRLANSLHGEPVPMVPRSDYDRLLECCRYIMSHPLLDEMTIRCRIHEALQAVPTKERSENG